MKTRWRLILLCSGLRNRPITFAIGLLSFLVGLFLVGLCLQFLVDLQFYNDRKLGQSASVGHLVLSKDISPLMALRPEVAVFTDSELAILRQTSFVRWVDPVIGNQFRAELFFQLGELRYGTELFFESVPNRFLAPVPDGWEWTPPAVSEQAKTIPIIIPAEFLTLYNLGFAPSRNLPILQESMLTLIPLHIRVEGRDGIIEIPARIVGTTEKIASLLVPVQFMEWANANFPVKPGLAGGAGKPAPRRLIVAVNDPTAPNISAWLSEHGYRDDNASSTVREAAFLLSSAISIIGIVAMLILGLSALVFLLNLKVYLNERSADLRLLVLLGYHPHRLALAAIAFMGIVQALGGLTVLAALLSCVDALHAYLAKSLFGFPYGLSWQVWIVVTICLLILPLLHYLSIRKHLALPPRIGQNVFIPIR